MGADQPERQNLGAAGKGGADRWAEISRQCNPPKSLVQNSLEFGEKLGGAALGSVVAGMAGVIYVEHPVGYVVAPVGAYLGWVYTSDLISAHDKALFESCIATQPNS